MIKRIVILLLFSGLVIGGITGYVYYNRIYSSNVIESDKEMWVYLPSGADYAEVLQILSDSAFVKNMQSFDWVAQKKNYPNKISSGRYLLKAEMNNNDLVDLLRSGKQMPLQVTFNYIRSLNELAGKMAEILEPDSQEFAMHLTDGQTMQKYGFREETFVSMFIPNTYEFYWDASTEDFLQRMASEYKTFWTETRKAKARKLGLSQSEVSTLASIVESETNKNDEKPIVAGVYLNRLRKNMLLQADPTLIFATKDWNAKRVLNKHKKVESPYNTYKYKGLPPGPIRIPAISSIDAVLNYNKHNFLYFCAKEDFSGYHNFAATYNEHLRNARKFQRALNNRGVYK